MRLKTSKTDKLDAQMIRLYSESENPDLWHPPSDYIIEATELHKIIELLLRQRTALKNKLHSLKAKGITKSPVVTAIRRQIRNLSFIWIAATAVVVTMLPVTPVMENRLISGVLILLTIGFMIRTPLSLRISC